MNYDDISPELKKLLDETPILTASDLEELAEANRELNRDPEHIADIIKAVFVNDIICEMEEQGLNKNQLAKKWGKSRQYLGNLLDKERARNFTIDTIVSLSMTLGLRPQRIRLDSMEEVKAKVTMTHNRVRNDIPNSNNFCQGEECSCREYSDDNSGAVTSSNEKSKAADTQLALAA